VARLGSRSSEDGGVRKRPRAGLERRREYRRVPRAACDSWEYEQWVHT